LPAAIEQLERAGLSTTRLDLRWQGLLARPLLLVAMVLVAACVSLRFFRFGGVARMVMYGVVAGFMLYLATQVGENLGTAGVMSAAAAAWSPAVFGTLLGVLALLHLEDG
jgi:lipopolysaccharide export system permease protein